MRRALVLLSLLAPALPAQTIDFEEWPDGSAIDANAADKGLIPIGDQFLEAFGVSFRLEDGSLPLLAKVGGKKTAFTGKSGAESACGQSGNTMADMPALGQNVGCYFLTDDKSVGGAGAPLVIRYSTPVLEASGTILDLDRKEAWLVQARDANDSPFAELLLVPPVPATDGNGKATLWSFPTGAPIHSIRFVYVGTSNDVGLGFDRFSPSSSSPCTGQLALYGDGVRGTGNLLPRIQVHGCGQVGSPFRVSISDALGSACGCLAFGTSQASMPAFGGHLLTSADVIVSHMAMPDGTYFLDLNVPPVPSLAGTSLFLQAGYVDPGAQQGVSLTRGLELAIGQ